MKKHFVGISLLTATFMLIAQGGQTKTHHVAKDSELETAVSICAEGDTILMAPGFYFADVQITTCITLRGTTSFPNDVILRRDNATTGLIDINGSSNNVPLRLERVRIEGSFSIDPVVDVFLTSLEVRNCVFVHNGNTYFGGGAINGESSSLVIEKSVFEYNGSGVGEGGAIKLVNCELNISDCSINRNYTQNSGGGIHMESGALDMKNCSFSQNSTTGDNGGGMTLETVEGSIVDCEFVSNVAQNSGSGLFIWAGSSVELRDTDVIDNQSIANIGGLVVSGGSSVILSECLLLGNEGSYFNDGAVAETCSALFQCCDLDIKEWNFLGTVEFDDSGCQVATQQESLGGIKAMFR